MSEPTTRTRLAAVWRDHLGLNGKPEFHDDIPDTTRFDSHGDSIDGVEICMAVEEEFAVEITDDQWHDHGTTFGQLLALVDRKLGEQTPASGVQGNA